MDPYMTYKLYEWQANRFKDNSLKGVYNVFMNMEMPLITVVAKMELKGISIDKEYTERLNKKYSALEKDCTDKINAELDKYKPKIEQWKLTPEANKKVEGWKELTNIQTDKLLKKTNIKSASDLSALYPKKYSVKSTDTGFVLCQWTVFKSKIEQLEDPISLDSPTQLSIFLYDILGLPRLETKNYKGNSSTGTGVDILEELAKKEKIPLIDLVLQRRTIHKIHHDFIEKLPKQAGIDGRIHCQFNSTGTDTGRFSSSDPNLQQIPARNKEIRMMFCAPKEQEIIKEFDSYLELEDVDEVETLEGWKKARDLKIGDVLRLEEDKEIEIKNISNKDYKIIIRV
jgi:DNA polymerase I-like protein with 3'-5' exonuclease and polymerase domains